MTYICYRGIEVSARLQYFLLGFEVIMLVVISIYALVKVYTNNARGGVADPVDLVVLAWRPGLRHRDRARQS